jgi:uncharacterized protein involved in tellurium resistance
VNLDPASAPPRPDLTFLRHRTNRKPAPAPAATSPSASSASSASSPAADFITGRTHHPHQRDAPAPSSSLDLSAPATPAAPAARPSAPALSSSLDLSEPPARPGAPAAPSLAASPAAPRLAVHRDRRIRPGEHHVLDVKAPTVTLNRLQSGIGALQIEAVASSGVGDLRLGAAYQLRDGVSSTVQYAGGNRFAPSSRRPIIVAGRDEYERLGIDLRQVTDLQRLTVYAFSESRSELTWGGTLVLTTFGGARVDLPLEALTRGKIGVLMSIYNVDGELVIRAEMETIEGDVREAARAYGYDRITWRDDRSPAD